MAANKAGSGPRMCVIQASGLRMCDIQASADDQAAAAIQHYPDSICEGHEGGVSTIAHHVYYDLPIQHTNFTIDTLLGLYLIIVLTDRMLYYITKNFNRKCQGVKCPPTTTHHQITPKVDSNALKSCSKTECL